MYSLATLLLGNFAPSQVYSLAHVLPCEFTLANLLPYKVTPLQLYSIANLLPFTFAPLQIYSLANSLPSNSTPLQMYSFANLLPCKSTFLQTYFLRMYFILWPPCDHPVTTLPPCDHLVKGGNMSIRCNKFVVKLITGWSHGGHSVKWMCRK